MADAMQVVRELADSYAQCAEANALRRVLAVAEAAFFETQAEDTLEEEMDEASGARIEGLSQDQEDCTKRRRAAVAALTTTTEGE